MKFQSQVVWVIRNSDSIIIFLGVPKYIENLPVLYFCLGDQKFCIPSFVVWGIRNSESSAVLFEGQKF